MASLTPRAQACQTWEAEEAPKEVGWAATNTESGPTTQAQGSSKRSPALTAAEESEKQTHTAEVASTKALPKQA